MAITLRKTWGHVQRETYFEVRADFDDGNGGIINEVLAFKTEPKELELTDAVKAKTTWLEARAAENPEKDAGVLNEQEKSSWSMVSSKVMDYLKEQVAADALAKEDAVTAAKYIALIESKLLAVATSKVDAASAKPKG